MQRQPIATDFSRPSALPTASIRPARGHNAEQDVNSDEYLDQLQEEWNRKIDDQVEILVNNMVDLVNIAQIGNKDQFRVAQEAFQAELKAESMVLAASSLLSLTHSLKLMLLLSDEREIAERREQELLHLRKDIDEVKEKAIQQWETISTSNS